MHCNLQPTCPTHVCACCCLCLPCPLLLLAHRACWAVALQPAALAGADWRQSSEQQHPQQQLLQQKGQHQA